ncbi:sugar ABC transporter ATP-binding protein [Maliponia aquimaris]|uniref:Ribose import ATP-binding protein RbsA n=1 Tax=Maliponia aquimaris TaxID=1673631 RepID=A0A238L0E7_9RHOB|nr:sugar ABC transporter ATP-binding protein [Maliponia aquimaris]SMX47826.1 Ribose import ATP-binding protein RbsA [Maliponia aquimaris]
MPRHTSIDPPAWEIRGLTKRFPGVLANDAVNLTLNRGEIHGLMGENGCGKSTLIKALMGVHQPDGGVILRAGQPVTIADPTAARSAGIAAVFQEFSLIPTLSVAENIHLGSLPGHRLCIDWTRMHARAAEVLARLDVAIDPAATVGDLSVADQQLVEIAKAIATDATMVILDEPTTALGLDEIAVLHRVLKGLKAQGAAILYVSHRLDEVVELVDCVTVLKDGRVVSTAEDTPVTIKAIVGAMIGEVSDHYPKVSAVRNDIALELCDIRTANRVNGVSFALHRGEVLGLGGVLGSGRTEIARAIFGVDRLTSGEIRLGGKRLRLRSPQDAVAAGIALIPENRKADGLFFNFTGLANISVARLDRLGPPAAMNLTQERALGRDLIAKLEVTPAAETRLVGLLSGGNQQKIVIARWLFAGASVFVLDEPTQGIDVGAKIAVYRLINELTAAGHAVVLISSDHDELLAMSDRIAVVNHGRVTDIRPVSAFQRADLVRASAEEEFAA